MNDFVEEKKSRTKENVENLQTLIKELNYIEDVNSQLNSQVETEREEHQKTKEELAVR